MVEIEHIGNLDTWPVEFGRDGNILHETQVQALVNASANATDLLVISHGWNNDEDEANALYRELLYNLSNLMFTAAADGNRRLIVLRVYWPSKRFAESGLIASGAAAGADIGRLIAAQIEELLKDFKCVEAGHPDAIKRSALEGLKSLLPRLEDDDGAQEDFVRLIRLLLTPTVNDEEDVLQDSFLSSDGGEIMKKLSRPFRPRVAPTSGATSVGNVDIGDWSDAGGAAGLGNFFRGVFNGAQNLLNLFTYYEMKERASNVGRNGVIEVLSLVEARNPALRVHLCGHSFGGRLVAAVLAFRPQPTAPEQGIRSVTLLQAAFSHNGFGQKYDGTHDGLFRVGFDGQRLNGPIVLTYTEKDKTVGLAYPIASRLRQQTSSGLGDANDPYGAIGRNGALFATADVDLAATKLLPVGITYPRFQSRRIYNLYGGPYITDHSAIRGLEVAQALKQALDASL